MNGILLGLASHFVGTLSGILTTPVMDWLDDVVQLTAKWPDWSKRTLVAMIAAVLPTVAALVPALHLSMNPADLLSRPEVQTIIGFVIAFLFKVHKNQAKIAASATPTTTSTGTAK